jgi:hypothetical protein
MSSGKKKKRIERVVLTKGCMLANDGSDDSVDADPFARSKNEMANQIKSKKGQKRCLNQYRKGRESAHRWKDPF